MATPIDSTADLIVTALQGLTGLADAEKWAPGMGGFNLPGAVVALPDVTRVGVEQPETQLGTRDWLMSYRVVFYFDLADAKTAQAQAASVLEEWIQAIDSETLSVSDASIIDAKVTTSQPFQVVDAPRPTLGYETTLELLKLV